MSDILKVLAQRIRYHRKNRGLTQVQLSMQSGVEHRHLQKIEAGTVDLRVGTISKIAKTLNVPACYLLETESSTDASGCQSEVFKVLSFPTLVMSADLIIQRYNPAFAKMMGYEPEDESLKGRSIIDILAIPNEIIQVKDIAAKVLSHRPEPKPFFVQLKTKNGNVIRRQTHWSYMYNDSNQITGFMCTYFDTDPQSVVGSMFDLVKTP